MKSYENMKTCEANYLRNKKNFEQSIEEYKAACLAYFTEKTGLKEGDFVTVKHGNEKYRAVFVGIKNTRQLKVIPVKSNGEISARHRLIEPSWIDIDINLSEFLEV